MAEYKLTQTAKTAYWKDIITSNLKGRDTQQMTAQAFLDLYPHAEIAVLQDAITALIAEGTVEQV